MNIQAEKLKLIEWLAGLNDLTIIERIKSLKENQMNNSDWWDEISDAEKAAIDEGIDDADNGRLIAHEIVRKRYEKWL